MTGLVDSRGNPLVIPRTYENKKSAPPKTGEAFGRWAGSDVQFSTLPGGGIVQFDLSKLALPDFRAMRDHYQVNASLAVLSFMQHQSDFHLECENQKIADHCEKELRNNWTQLNRSFSMANWSGYAPTVLNWENDTQDGKIVLSKIKDLIPEECRVNWKLVDGWAPPGRTPPKFKVYDGIVQDHAPWPIPKENTVWYPLLMEHGDYYGRKLLRPAFQSWFFSILLHLFANRYYERFGEPTPVGRAPYDEDVTTPQGTTLNGADYMLNLLQQLRSRSAVVLPNDRSQDSTSGKPSYDYEIEYLESQMRGADFERYMTRLDEEISIGLFTPILLLRTADTGSYTLGQGHMQLYLWMLNAMNDDRKQYYDNYLLSKMVDYNFGTKAPRARIVFRKLGNTNAELLNAMLTALLQKDRIKVDVKELGQMAGMKLTEIEQTLAAPAVPSDPAAPAGPKKPAKPAGPAKGRAHAGLWSGDDTSSLGDMSEAWATSKEINTRVRGQVEAAFRDDTFGKEFKINMGFKRRFEKALASHDVAFPLVTANQLYGRMDNWIADVLPLGKEEFSSPDNFMSLFSTVLNNEISELGK